MKSIRTRINFNFQISKFFSYLCILHIRMARFFRRYKSTIYGNYRKAYLIDGMLTGVAMSVISALRDWLATKPMAMPENYITELVLLVGIVWASYHYRKQLPGEKVTLKELMLLGLGIGVVSAVVYGLWVWLRCGVINTGLVDYYNQSRIEVMDPAEKSEAAKVAIEMVRKYTAGDWAFIAGFRSAVMSIIITFFTALVLRTEKGEVRVRQKK